MLVNRSAMFGSVCIGLLIFLGSCVRSETELLTEVEATVRADPFIIQFRKDMERAFGCKFESDPEFQMVGVYLSLYAEVGHQQDDDNQSQLPTVKVDIYCHSVIVQRVYLDINLWRGGVESFDRFTRIKPDMINKIRFEPSASFARWISERQRSQSGKVNAAEVAISAPIWADFASQVSAMFPQGCKSLSDDAVFFTDSQATITPNVPYQKFSAVLSCPKPGPRKPGFSFQGLYFPSKGFVLPSVIEAAGAYVN